MRKIDLSAEAFTVWQMHLYHVTGPCSGRTRAEDTQCWTLRSFAWGFLFAKHNTIAFVLNKAPLSSQITSQVCWSRGDGWILHVSCLLQEIIVFFGREGCGIVMYLVFNKIAVNDQKRFTFLVTCLNVQDTTQGSSGLKCVIWFS